MLVLAVVVVGLSFTMLFVVVAAVAAVVGVTYVNS